MIRIIRIIFTTFSLYLVTHLFVFAVLPFVILLSIIDQTKIPVVKQWFIRWIFAIVGVRIKVSGLDNFTSGHPYIIVSNYPCGYAGFALIGQFPHACIVAHAFLRKIPLLGQTLSRIGTIFVRPGTHDRGIKALDRFPGDRGDLSSIIILPEGRCTRDGRLHRFRRGFVYIHRQTSFDILPVTLNEFYKLKPLGRLYADPDARPQMLIHPPVSASITDKMSDQELINHVKKIVESQYSP